MKRLRNKIAVLCALLFVVMLVSAPQASANPVLGINYPSWGATNGYYAGSGTADDPFMVYDGQLYSYQQNHAENMWYCLTNWRGNPHASPYLRICLYTRIFASRTYQLQGPGSQRFFDYHTEGRIRITCHNADDSLHTCQWIHTHGAIFDRHYAVWGWITCGKETYDPTCNDSDYDTGWEWAVHDTYGNMYTPGLYECYDTGNYTYLDLDILWAAGYVTDKVDLDDLRYNHFAGDYTGSELPQTPLYRFCLN